MNTPVSFEIAKLLKEKGFDLPCNNYTSQRDGDYFSNEKQTISYKNYNEITNIYSRPTIAEVVMWLYEKHGIWISVDIILNLYFKYNINKSDGSYIEDLSPYIVERFKNPTEAYSQAVEYVLKNLI